jgi:signal transduction histidine kinase
VARDLARRLSLPREKVLVSFNPTPTDVVVFRVRNEELRAEHMEHMHERRGAMRIDTEALRALHARRMKAESAGDVAAVRAIDEELRSEVAKIREARARLRMGMEHGPGEHVRVETRRSDDGETVVVTRENVAPSAPAPPARVAAAPAPPEPPEPPRFAPPPPGVVLMSRFLVAAELGDGRWLVMRQQSNAETADWIMRAALGIGATLVVLLLLALLFARRLAAPIQRFAEAARRVGIDPGEAPVKEEGPAELRTAARAVNAMQARLRALVAERTEMLAAVAHDLRTPLMRLRLAAENADPAIRDKLAKETGEIDAMVSSFIAFARDDPTREARVKLDLAALIQSIVDDRAEAREDVTFEGPDRLVVTGQPVGLKRLVENLIDNAVKYGGVARVVVRQDGAEACIEVSDEGPGIPKAERERVFRPFVRGEGAPGAGAGLGLAAAREIARAHGGDVEIADTQPRGALVRVTLPV